MTIGRALKIGAAQLAKSASPQLDAEVLLAYVLKCSRSDLIIFHEQSLNSNQLVKFFYLISRRRRGRPIAYLTGQKEFYGRSFVVNKNVLVPRPSSELLVEETIAAAQELANKLDCIMEIGTGSGCIAVSLASVLPEIKIIATDISPAAIAVAKINAANYGLEQQIEFMAGDMLTPLLNRYGRLNHCLIIANPPYLLPGEITNELKFEPPLALQGGGDGLGWYKKLFSQIAQLAPAKRPRGLILEINPLTYDCLIALTQNILPWCQVAVKKDLSGFNRLLTVILAKKGEQL